jgi:hypothetical protein
MRFQAKKTIFLCFKQLIYKSFNQNKLFSYYVSSVTVIKSYTYLNDFLLQNNISCGFYAVEIKLIIFMAFHWHFNVLRNRVTLVVHFQPPIPDFWRK